MWKRVAVLVVVGLLPISAVAHTKLFYEESYRSDYRKVEIVETRVTAEPAEPTVTPLVEIPLESTLTPEPTLTPEVPEQITTPSDLTITPPEEVF